MEPSVCCFGEPLLRIMPDPSNHQARIFRGGAELNVAVALAKWKQSVSFLSAMPENGLADQFLAELKNRGIQTDQVIRSGSRLGTYYLLGGTDLRNQVVYDRQFSSFGQLQPGTISWKELLPDSGWLHFTTINASLSDTLLEVNQELVDAALEKGLKISVDLNFRPALWKNRSVPVEKFRNLVKGASLLFGNIWSASDLLDVPIAHQIDGNSGVDSKLEASAHCYEQLCSWMPNLHHAGFSFRFTDQLPGKYMATIHAGTQWAISQIFHIKEIVDKVGSGDSCMAGLLYGILQGKDLQDTIDFAAAAAVSKLGQEGDWNQWEAEDIEKLILKVV